VRFDLGVTPLLCIAKRFQKDRLDKLSILLRNGSKINERDSNG
jgi:hypothetical protein